jgi:hypothetical protein
MAPSAVQRHRLGAISEYDHQVADGMRVAVRAAALAADKPFTMFGYATESCGKWVKSADNAGQRALYISWVTGFVSGYNFGNPHNQVNLGRMPDNETLTLYIDNFCRENPLNNFVVAAPMLVQELREKPTPRKRNGS